MSTFIFNTAKAAFLRADIPALSASMKVMLLAGQKSGVITSGSTDITGLASTSSLAVGMEASHAAFAAGSTITSILGATSVRCSGFASYDDAAATVTFKPWKKQDYVSDFSGLELACTGYVGGFAGSGRRALSSAAIAVDDTNSQGWLDASDITWTSVGTAEVVTGAVLVIEKTSDNDSYAIAHYDDGYPITLSGTNLVQAWSPSGLLRG